MVQSHKLKLEFFFLNLKQGPLKQILQRQEQRFLNIMTIWLLSPYNPFFLQKPLRGKCPNTKFFLVHIFQHLDQKKLCIWTIFTQWTHFDLIRDTGMNDDRPACLMSLSTVFPLISSPSTYYILKLLRAVLNRGRH